MVDEKQEKGLYVRVQNEAVFKQFKLKVIENDSSIQDVINLLIALYVKGEIDVKV